MGYLLYSFVSHWATLGLHLCVAQGRHFADRYLVKQEKMFKMSKSWVNLVFGSEKSVSIAGIIISLGYNCS